MSIHFASDVVQVAQTFHAGARSGLDEVFRQHRALCQSEGRRCAADCMRRQLGLCVLANED